MRLTVREVCVVSALCGCPCLSVMREHRCMQSQAAEFTQMFPDQGSWLKLLPQKRMRIKKFVLHQLVSLLHYQVAAPICT